MICQNVCYHHKCMTAFKKCLRELRNDCNKKRRKQIENIRGNLRM